MVNSIIEQYRLPRGTADVKEMLVWEPEAVFIHTATETHFDLVMACIEKRIAVYVDKPLPYDNIHRPEGCAISAGRILEIHMLADELISYLND